MKSLSGWAHKLPWDSPLEMKWQKLSDASVIWTHASEENRFQVYRVRPLRHSAFVWAGNADWWKTNLFFSFIFHTYRVPTPILAGVPIHTKGCSLYIQRDNYYTYKGMFTIHKKGCLLYIRRDVHHTIRNLRPSIRYCPKWLGTFYYYSLNIGRRG